MDDYLIAIESITEESGNLELFALGLSNFDELTLVGEFIDYKLYYISSDLATIDILYGILAANYIVGNSKNINFNYRISRYTGAYYDYILTNVRFGASQTFGSTITVSNPNYPVSGPSVVCTSASSYTISELPAGTSVAWAKSSNLNFIGANTGTSIQVAGASSNGSQGWIKPTITLSCGSFTGLEKN